MLKIDKKNLKNKIKLYNIHNKIQKRIMTHFMQY